MNNNEMATLADAQSAELQAWICGRLSEAYSLDTQELALDALLVEVGVDSILKTSLLCDVESLLGLELTTDEMIELFYAESVRDLVAAIARARAR